MPASKETGKPLGSLSRGGSRSADDEAPAAEEAATQGALPGQVSAAQKDSEHALPAVLQVVEDTLLWQRTLNTWLTIPAVMAANNIVAAGQAGGDAGVAVRAAALAASNVVEHTAPASHAAALAKTGDGKVAQTMAGSVLDPAGESVGGKSEAVISVPWNPARRMYKALPLEVRQLTERLRADAIASATNNAVVGDLAAQKEAAGQDGGVRRSPWQQRRW
jgi:hypothetical protein